MFDHLDIKINQLVEELQVLTQRWLRRSCLSKRLSIEGKLIPSFGKCGNSEKIYSIRNLQTCGKRKGMMQIRHIFMFVTSLDDVSITFQLF